MRAMMVAGGVMEFELLRLPPQSKTVGPWTFQQGGWGRRRGWGRVVCACVGAVLLQCEGGGEGAALCGGDDAQ